MPDSLYVFWDNKEHLFLVELPYWNGGTWTGDLDKACKYKHRDARDVANSHPSLKMMTVEAAKSMLATATYVRRRII